MLIEGPGPAKPPSPAGLPPDQNLNLTPVET